MDPTTARERITDHVNAMRDAVWDRRNAPEENAEVRAFMDPWPVGECYGGWRLHRERGVLKYLEDGAVEYSVEVDDLALPERRLEVLADVAAWFRGEPQVLADFLRATSTLTFEFRSRLLPCKTTSGFAIQIDAAEEPRTWRLLIGEGTDFAQVQRAFVKLLKWSPEDVTRWLVPEWAE